MWKNRLPGDVEYITARDWPYKEYTIPVQIDPNIANQLIYGEFPMPKRKRKSKIKKGPPTKREKELQAALAGEESRHRGSIAHYRKMMEDAEAKCREQGVKITQLSDKVAALELDKRFLQQTIQHLLPGNR